MKVVLNTLTDALTGTQYTPPFPVDITELYDVNHTTGIVNARDITVADIKAKWQGLPSELDDRNPAEITLDVTLSYATQGGPINKGHQQPMKRKSVGITVVPSLASCASLTALRAFPYAELTTRTIDDEHAAYDPDPEGTGRFGWRRPGMHLQKPPHPDVLLTHGPGKRKKTKRK